MIRRGDTVYMQRCLELALKAEGCTSPNPMVGAVVVYNDTIIGEGYHLKAGTPHAEVHALNAVHDRSALPYSTLYVSLEPCSHYGRTPPCAAMIIGSGIKRVVVGTTDTSSKVAGRGIQMMREAGIEVITGVCENECRMLNRRFFTWHEKKRPYVILKWARSADGFIDLKRLPGDKPEQHWITGMSEKVLVHRWRASEDAILAGGGTVRADDPQLDVRLWSGKNPLKVIVTGSGNLNSNAAIFRGEGRPVIFTRNKEFAVAKAEVIYLSDDHNTIDTILDTLYERNILSLFVEGGAWIISEFVRSGLWDEARRFTGTVAFRDGVTDPFPEMMPETVSRFEKSILEIGFNYNVKN